MRIFEAGSGVSRGAPDLILLFGSGLVGRPIGIVLERAGYGVTTVPFRWGLGRESAKQDADELFKTVEWRMVQGSDRRNADKRLAIIWAAGRCGFGSSQKDTDIEQIDFEVVAEGAQELVRRRSCEFAGFHFVSSAGALFEGSGLVTDHTDPVPLRPYGVMKLRQERYLWGKGELQARVYRPSSVYGASQSSSRRNLIGVLIKGATRSEVCQISGSLGTLRDYVHADDVGSLIANKVLSDADETAGAAELLATFRPSSIYEIRKIVELVTRRHVFLRLDPEPYNSLSITFSPSLNTDPQWRPRDVSTGIKAVASSW